MPVAELVLELELQSYAHMSGLTGLFQRWKQGAQIRGERRVQSAMRERRPPTPFAARTRVVKHLGGRGKCDFSHVVVVVTIHYSYNAADVLVPPKREETCCSSIIQCYAPSHTSNIGRRKAQALMALSIHSSTLVAALLKTCRCSD